MLLVPHLVDSRRHKPPRPELIGATLSPFHQRRDPLGSLQDSQKNISHPLVHPVEIHYFPHNFGKNRVEQDPFGPVFPVVAKFPGGFSPDPGDPTTSYRCHLFGTACQLWTDGYQEPCGWATRRATPGTSWDLRFSPPFFDVFWNHLNQISHFFWCEFAGFVSLGRWHWNLMTVIWQSHSVNARRKRGCKMIQGI